MNRHEGIARVGLAVALISIPASAPAQPISTMSTDARQRIALDSLYGEAARQTAHYADRRVAVADGYRRIGTDFPGMGEHWLHPGALLVGAIDAARPTLLTYATLDGTPTLLGLGFLMTTHGDSGAKGIPGWPDTWHEHSGLFADESGARTRRGSASPGGTKVWVLHLWTGLQNPAGKYSPDNWALPFARAGIAAPLEVDFDLGRAFSLGAGGDVYLRDVLTDAGLRDSASERATDVAIAAARADVQEVAARARAAQRISPDDVVVLRKIWRTLGDSLRARLGPAVEPFLAPPHPSHGPSLPP